jgi:hypothetical protein
MRSALFLILAFCCSFAHADVLIVQHLNEIRTNSNLFAASSMVYFNPKDRTPDERTLTAAFGALVVMDTKITQVDNPPAMRDAYEEMNGIFKVLEKTKRRESGVFPEKVLRILQLNQVMQAAVDELYKAEIALTPSPVALLNGQSTDISNLLMDYQLRRYPLDDAQKAPFKMDAEQMPELDKKIDENFKLLLQQRPQNADYLDPAYKNYRFVRKQLLQSKGRPNGGAEFYMTRTVIDLNDLGAILAIEAQGLDPENPQDR